MMDPRARVEPFGFDRVFQANAEPAAAGSNDLADHVHDLLARLAAMERDHQEELARARTEAFQAGLDQARHEATTALLSAADAIHAAIDDLDARFADAIAQQSQAAADVALAAAEALAGHALDQAPLRAVDEALGRVLGQVARGTRLCVRINPDQHEALTTLLAERQRHDRRQLHLAAMADPAVAPGDAVIFWDEGGLAVDAAARRAAVMAELDPALRGEDQG